MKGDKLMFNYGLCCKLKRARYLQQDSILPGKSTQTQDVSDCGQQTQHFQIVAMSLQYLVVRQGDDLTASPLCHLLLLVSFPRKPILSGGCSDLSESD